MPAIPDNYPALTILSRRQKRRWRTREKAVRGIGGEMKIASGGA